tara:strand:+ start:79 stop:348 length:270 start_codon:yes stop_codon:yes gene_type:complete
MMANFDSKQHSKSAFLAMFRMSLKAALYSKRIAKTYLIKSVTWVCFCYFCYAFAMRLLCTGIAIAKIANTFRYCYFARPQLLNSARVAK